MGGRGASFGGGGYEGGRYGTKYNATEVLMFSDLEDTLGIGQNDKEAVQLMMDSYDVYRSTNTEAIAGHNVERSWNETVVSALKDQGVNVDRTNFLTSEDDYPTFTAMYSDIQGADGIDGAYMTKNKNTSNIHYTSGNAHVRKYLDTGTFVTVDDQTFTDLASAMAHAKKLNVK